ncbi:MAG: alanine--tRNA ligase [Acidobacteria bacterium]|nr:alanine--tRNA ligase [Acidobacteriota bacterium]
MTSSNTIRQSFLNYFEQKAHTVAPSSSLIPFNDPTLLFTNAGMNQFKNIFLGNQTAPYNRAATSQKCMRVSGKHNDFKDVGHSSRHHTFFEMLGNFSFGDYFKKDAIHFAWELLTKVFNLDSKRLWVTVYKKDDDAFNIWHTQERIPAEKILRLGEADNFWAMGDTGPCGPCSELHYDLGRSPLKDHGECDLTCSCGRWVEVWNLVFMQYNRDPEGKMNPLPAPSIDTGMGFERITTILQNKTTTYDTDLFIPLINAVSEISDIKYGSDPSDDVSMKIIADHVRAATFVIGDGQYPGNDKRGYVLRKIMRRAIVHGKRLGIEDPFLYRISGTVVETMKAAYPELVQSRDTIARVIKQEEDSFAGTLGEGLKDFNDRAKNIKAMGSRTLPGEEAFFLYDTRGLPIEIIEDLAMENGLVVDEAGFTKALEKQQERSRRDYLSGKVNEQVAQSFFDGKTSFVGYGISGPVKATVRAIIVDGNRTDRIEAGKKGELILDATPFYAEAGGQVGDTGYLVKSEGSARVDNTAYQGTAIAHHVELEKGSLQSGDEVDAIVDLDNRYRTMKNHTATHLLQAALRKVLGDHVKQAGSLVSPDRLRFDFVHYAPLTMAEIRKIEDYVNECIWKNTDVVTTTMDLNSAMKSGAVALFGEKYQENVRVVEVPGFSKELCGGTHVTATGSIGLFKIISEGGISAGIRRIEALTGPAAFERFRSSERILDGLHTDHKVSRHEIDAFITKLQGNIRELQRQNLELKARSARANITDMLESARQIHGIRVLSAQVPSIDRAGLRNLADELKQKIGSGIVILGTDQEGKAALVVMVTGDISKKVPAGRIIKKIAHLVNGGGGGKPELAEAGGKDSTKLADAIEYGYSVVEEFMSGEC